MDTGWTWGFFLAFSWTHQGQGVHMLWATSWCRFLHQKRWDNDQPTNLSGLRDFTKQKRRVYIQRPLTMGCGTWRCTHMHTYVCNIFIAHQYHRFVISNLVITFPALIYFQRDAGPLFQLYLHNLIYILLRVAWISPSQSHKGQFLRLVCWRLASAQEVARDYGDVSGARLSCCRLFWSILHLEGGAGCQQYAGRHVSTNTAVLNDVGGIDGGFYAVSGVCADKGSQSATVDDFAHLWSLGNLEEWRVVHTGLLTLLHYCCGSNKRKFRSLYFRVTEFQSKEVSQQRSLTARSLTAKKSHSKEVHSKEVSQQRSLTAKKSHSKEVSQQRSLTKKKSHSKEVSQQRSLAAKKSHSKEVSQQRSPTAKKSHNKEVSQQRSLTAKKSHSKEVRQQRSPTTKKSHSKEVRQQRSPKAKKSHSKDDTKRDENNRHQRWASELRMNKMRWDEMRWHWPRWSEMKWDEVRWGQVKMRKDPTLKRDDGGIKSEKVVAAKHGRLGCTL